MDTNIWRLIIVVTLLVMSYIASANNPQCPEITPPGTQTPTAKYCVSTYCSTDISTLCAHIGGDVSDRYEPDSRGPPFYKCHAISVPDYLYGYVASVQNTCNTGYQLINSMCVLSNPDVVPCPPITCNAGSFVGMGKIKVNTLDYQSGGTTCWKGCKVYTKETMAIWGLKPVNGPENMIDLIGDFFQAGGTCNEVYDGELFKYSETDTAKPQVPALKPGEFTHPKENCITDAAGSQVCIDRQLPGCGMVNNKSFCADDILQKPGVGLCTFVGSTGYVCAMGLDNKITPPKITGEPDPIPTAQIQLPVKQTTGDPPSTTPYKGLNPDVPNSGFNLKKTIPGEVGYYPGPSGNGSGNNDKADEVNTPSQAQCTQFPNSLACQNTADYWAQFAKHSGNSAAVVDEIKKTNEALNKTPTTGLSSQSITNQFNPESISSSNTCPAPKSFTVGGQSYSLSYEPICTIAEGVRPVFLAVMGLFAAYIVLGTTNKSGV